MKRQTEAAASGQQRQTQQQPFHGTLNAMFLPAVIRFNAAAESIQKEQRLQRMAQAMGLTSASDIPDAIQDMNAGLDLPTGLAAMGVQNGGV